MLAALCLALGSALPVAPVSAAPAREARQTYARVILTLGGEKYAHPGFFAYVGEESIFNFEIGGKVHAVTVGIQGEEDQGYDLDVIYKAGNKLVVDGSGHVAPGKSMKLEKGEAKVQVFIDPHG